MTTCPICHTPADYTYCSLACSNRSRTAKNEVKYMLSPKRCLVCESPIPYNKRFDNTYCSSSCSAKASNAKKPKKPKSEPKGRGHYLHAKALEQFELGG